MRPRVGFLCSRIRVEEKLLLQELERRDVEVRRIDDERAVFSLDRPAPLDVDVVLARSVHFGRTVAALRVIESQGVATINRAAVVETCGDKLATEVALRGAGVPAPRSSLAFSEESALNAIEELGYPVVLKPVVGSWGRLVARCRDRDAAEAILEHRATLGSWQQRIFYIQEYVEKPGRDIRAFVVGDETIAAIYRESDHWVTNTARGASTRDCPVTDELDAVARAAAAAVGGGVLSVDIVEDQGGRLLVLEVNHGTEFRNSIDVTGVDIPARMIDFALAQAGAVAEVSS